MALKDWPRPLRLAVLWSLFVLITVLSFAPLLLTAQTFYLAASQQLTISWSRLLGGYATAITVPITLVIAATVAHQTRHRPPGYFLAYCLFGGIVGLFVGLVLSIITGGYSLLSAPAVSYLTFVVAWLIRRPDRDQPPGSSSKGTSA